MNIFFPNFKTIQKSPLLFHFEESGTSSTLNLILNIHVLFTDLQVNVFKINVLSLCNKALAF